MRQIIKYLFLFSLGGAIYYGIEWLFRSYSHPTMFLLGGICFLICGFFNEFLGEDTPLIAQMFLCAIAITTLELVFGYILNIKMGLHIWDYSSRRFNFKGQICLLFSVIWFFLGGLAIIVDDYIRFWLYKEAKPSYVLFRKHQVKKEK